jgi:hypothetical protein
MQMICAGAALTAAAAASGEPARIHPAALASPSTLAFAYLIIFGSLAAYSAYQWLIRHATSQLAGTYAFVNPLVALLLGWWLLGEHVAATTLLATAIIVTGIALIILRPARPPSDPHDPADSQPPDAAPRLGDQADTLRQPTKDHELQATTQSGRPECLLSRVPNGGEL